MSYSKAWQDGCPKTYMLKLENYAVFFDFVKGKILEQGLPSYSEKAFKRLL